MHLRNLGAPALQFCLLATMLVSGNTAGGQEQPRAAAPTDAFAGLQFRNIGPAAMGGRIDDLAVLESNPAIFYVGTATGGLWKTMNNGTTWEVLFDDLDDAVSIGDIAIAPNDANTVWVGTGENNNRQSGSWGNGVYKSVDGGQTFRHMGLRDSRHIARIVLDPVDHDVVYVASLGSLWGPGKERGVYKSTDGGLTWAQILFVNDDTGATELVQDPANNKVLYAATYQRRRAQWGFSGGGPGSAIHKSSDAGRTWTRLTTGIPEGPLGRIGMDIYRKNSNVIYARIEHPTESGTYRSDDAGLTWRKMSSVNPRPMYFSQVRIDPTNDLRIYVLGVQIHISDDGGKTFIENGALHSDHHAMWINPANSNHIIDGTDGGVGVSYDRGKNWEGIYNMDLGQYYHVGYDMDSPYNLCGGLQDNYTWCGPSAVRSRNGIVNDDWYQIQGGDGFEAVIDPNDSDTIYAESQDGNVVRVNRRTNERQTIRPLPDRGEPNLRWNWNTPIHISPHSSSTIYVGANKVFKSTDRGQSWQAISGELTQSLDRESLSLMGQTAKDFKVAKNDGVQSYGNLVQLVESPKQAGVLYAGADDGSVNMTRDGGKTWANLDSRFRNLPKGAYVSGLVASVHDANTVYVAFDNHMSDDYDNHLYASADGGNNFRSISEGLPKGQVVMTVAEDPKNAAVLYAGTEFGLFVSTDRGGSWNRVRSGLPTVPIHEIVFHPRENDMILATHGRSLWILDDSTPIRQAGEAMRTDAFLFDFGRPAMQFNPANDRGFVTDKPFRGKNPTFGAPISYYLKDVAPTASVSLRIRDAAGDIVRELRANDLQNQTNAGINRVYWDLRYQPLVAQGGTPAGGGGGGGGFGGGGNNGPFVLPGDFGVTLVVGGKDIATKSLRVVGDRLAQMTDADRTTWHNTALSLHRLQEQANDAAAAVTQLGEQFQSLESVMKTAANAPGEAKTAIEAAGKQLTELRRRLGVTVPGQAGTGGGGGGAANQNVRGAIGQTKGQLMNAHSLPSDQQQRALTQGRDDLAQVIIEVNSLIATMPSLFDKLGAGGVKPAALKPLRPVGSL
ncbi:MAG: glycosyl hydrolase [Acidobacteria bacterium]|nr:glycosyl hydrolase [Acidobacteriota bacterium]